jgi:hypothetical protein
MPTGERVTSVAVTTAASGASILPNELGMRAMQQKVWAHRGEQYLLIKSPPASGKSRALMFVALDKLANQGVKQTIVVVPERSIGGSFADEPLTRHGFWSDWTVRPRWNLCNVPGTDDAPVAKSKVKAVAEFLESEDKVLVCTHATFRFAFDELGPAAFDDRLIAVDEFHHVSANPDNRLGAQLAELIARDKAHIVAMTGSYFRGDATAVLAPGDEAKFQTVTYTYYEQLNGYAHLKTLDIGYFFYSGPYLDDIMKVLDPSKKTIVHIPNVNARESTRIGKTSEANAIMDALGRWDGEDEVTGFHRILQADGRLLKVADLVDDDPVKRDRVVAALKNPAQRGNRDHVDIIIALGMAKEGFDWIWCEHALTVGYRSSLTEIVQIIGRATRDAPGKPRAMFTNLIAEPDASQEAVLEAINDTLKAIACSLLMEQVLAPRFDFTPKNRGKMEGFDYGEGGYQDGRTNVGVSEDGARFHIEIAGLVEPKSPEATRICRKDLNEVIAAFVQDKRTAEAGLFNEETAPQELTQERMGKIVRDKYPELTPDDIEAVRQHAVAALNVVQEIKKRAGGEDGEPRSNTAFIDGARRYALEVKTLEIDMIDRVNPFSVAYAVLAKALNEGTLKQVKAAVEARKATFTEEEARDLTRRAVQFQRERGRVPDINAADAWEQRLAQGVAAFARMKAQAAREGAARV